MEHGAQSVLAVDVFFVTMLHLNAGYVLQGTKVVSSTNCKSWIIFGPSVGWLRRGVRFERVGCTRSASPKGPEKVLMQHVGGAS